MPAERSEHARRAERSRSISGILLDEKKNAAFFFVVCEKKERIKFLIMGFNFD
jgi:hypothetical protein